MRTILLWLFVEIFLLPMIFCSLALGAGKPKLPPAENIVKDDVDHWGLAFSDQLAAFESHVRSFAQKTGIASPDYILGAETSLRKTFRNKYWFKGDITDSVSISCARNESEAFQLAIIPGMGRTLKDIHVIPSKLTMGDGKGEIPGNAVRLWQVDFVKSILPQYPTRHVGDWPDPLLPIENLSIHGTDLGLIWCEIHVPGDAAPGDYSGALTIKPSNARAMEFKINLHVWDFVLPDRVPFPTVVWTGDQTPRGEKMAPDDYRSLCAIFLDHHIDPISVGKNRDLKSLDENLDFCLRRGLMFFETIPFKDTASFRPYYEHLKEKKWIQRAIVYGARDEPTKQQFEEMVIPATSKIREAFPGLKVFLATQYYDGLDRGVDIWLTDMSTNFHSWMESGRPGRQELWWYFCHLPIQVQMERPLVDAPNMQIDNDAIEHRIPYWMAYDYSVKGIFIYAGNRWPEGNEDWPETPFQLPEKKYTFPYAGIHNGNGFLVYPGPIPSIRLKILRDGIEDYWYLSRISELSGLRKFKEEALALLNGIKPVIFVDTHYFNRRPEALISYRKRLAEFIERASRQI